MASSPYDVSSIFVPCWSGRQGRAQFAGGEAVEGAEATGEFRGVQVALAVEPAQKIGRWLLPFLRVALVLQRNHPRAVSLIRNTSHRRHTGVYMG
jgi:hypothetical protein